MVLAAIVAYHALRLPGHLQFCEDEAMESAPVSREDHLRAIRDKAMSRLDAGDGLQGVLEFLTAGLRSCGEPDPLTMRILATEGASCVDEGDVPGMRKLIGFLCGPQGDV